MFLFVLLALQETSGFLLSHINPQGRNKFLTNILEKNENRIFNSMENINDFENEGKKQKNTELFTEYIQISTKSLKDNVQQDGNTKPECSTSEEDKEFENFVNSNSTHEGNNTNFTNESSSIIKIADYDMDINEFAYDSIEQWEKENSSISNNETQNSSSSSNETDEFIKTYDESDLNETNISDLNETKENNSTSNDTDSGNKKSNNFSNETDANNNETNSSEINGKQGFLNKDDIEKHLDDFPENLPFSNSTESKFDIQTDTELEKELKKMMKG